VTWRSAQASAGRAIAALGYPLINALGHTLRWRVEGCTISTRSRASAASR
jgi:hypothetical protein